MELFLVNTRHLHMVPGRNTDVKDGAWIAQLLQYGLLRARVVPAPEVRQWRDRTRQRTTRSGQHTAVVNRIHTTLEEVNRKLSTVIRDIMGVSGRRMRRAIAAGQADAVALAARGHARLKAPPAA